MPRGPRITIPGVPYHLIQSGKNRHVCFFTDDDYLIYLDWLYEYARDSGCELHAYTLVTNHVHLLLTPKSQHGAGELMKRLGKRYSSISTALIVDLEPSGKAGSALV